ncbi:Uncharacterised protein [Yersinia pekkanenii]|uniref:Uncharacterized protein n=1 Tax=Yersinia pekkanenii TaxID=1288385 RepID=A0A0T9RS00_9GAMM|nr:Uncharacterised protein [Yersinia pekkanenii]
MGFFAVEHLYTHGGGPQRTPVFQCLMNTGIDRLFIRIGLGHYQGLCPCLGSTPGIIPHDGINHQIPVLGFFFRRLAVFLH